MLVLVLVAATVGGTFLAYGLQKRRQVQSIVATAEALERDGKVGEAVRHLYRFERETNDANLVRLLVRLVQTPEMARQVTSEEIVRLNEKLLRLDPDGPDARDCRRRIARQYLVLTEFLRSNQRAMEIGKAIGFERVAESDRGAAALNLLLAIEREESNKPNAETLTLLGWALMLETPEDVTAPERYEEVVRKFEEARKADPDFTEASDRLANLYMTRMKDGEKALAVIGDVIQARPNDVRARIFRYLVLRQLGREEEARIDLQHAREVVPADDAELKPLVEIELIKDELRRHDVPAARARFDALARERRGDPRLMSVELDLSLAEGKTEESISILREGVKESAGTDVSAMLDLINHYHHYGRASEARPLLARLRSLMSGQEGSSLLDFLECEQLALSGRPWEAIQKLEALKRAGFGGSVVTRAFQSRLYLALARCQLAMGNTTEAEKAFREGLLTDRKAITLRMEFAEWLGRDRPEEALRVLQEGLQDNPNDLALKLVTVDFLVRRQAAVPAEKRNWVEVDRRLAELEASGPKNNDIARVRVQRRLLGGDLEGALSELEALCKRSPKELDSWRRRAEVLIQLGKPQDALAVLREAAQPDAVGDKVDLRLYQARVLSRLNRGREARELVTRDIAKLSTSEQAAAWKGLGELLLEHGDLFEAREAFEKWSNVDPQDMRPFLHSLEFALNTDDGATANRTIKALKRLLGEDSNTYRLALASALIALSDRSVAQLDTPEARSSLDRRLGRARDIIADALTKAPNMPDALLLDAEVKRRIVEFDRKIGKTGEIDEKAVIDAYAKAFRQGSPTAFPKLIDLFIATNQLAKLDELPTKTWIYDRDRVAAELAVKRGEKDAAVRYMDRVVQTAKLSPESLAWKAKLLALMGQGELAEAEVQHLIEQQPNELDHWVALVRLRVNRGRAGDVDAVIERAKTKVTGRPPELVEAACRQAAGDLPRADFAYQKALENNPNDDIVALHVASYYQDTGRLAMAEAPLRALLKRNPTERRAARSLAALLAARARTLEDWQVAWNTLGLDTEPADPKDEPLEDRFARAVLLTRCPESSRRAEGIKKLEALLADIPPESTLALGTRGELVQGLLLEQDYVRAIAIAGELVARSPTPMAYLLQVEGLMGAGRRDEAKAQLDKLAELAPGDPREALLRVRLFWDPAKPDASAPALEAAYNERVAKQPKYAETFGRLVLSTLDQARAADTIAARVAAKLAEKNPAISWTLARLLSRQDRSREVLELCQTSASKGDGLDRIEACRLTVATVSRTNDPNLRKLAETIINDSVKADPKNLELRICQAMLLHIQGRYEEELATYNDLIKQNVESPVLFNNLAWSLCEFSQKYDEALKYVNLAIDRFGNNPGLLDTRGVIETRLKDPAKAVKDLKEVVEAQPSPTRRFHLARAYALAGETEEAKRHRDQAVKDGLKPTDLEPAEKADFEALSKL